VGDSTPDENADGMPFASILHSLNKGRIHTQLGDELRALVAAVKDTGKRGSLTLSLSVSAMQGDEDGVLIAARIGSKVPQFDPATSVFYADDHNNLSRTPVRQPSMFEEIV
jgi:hypothetical protein